MIGSVFSHQTIAHLGLNMIVINTRTPRIIGIVLTLRPNIFDRLYIRAELPVCYLSIEKLIGNKSDGFYSL